jgi:hypothetical protein
LYPEYRDSPPPTIANLDAVVVIECGEPLVNVSDLSFFPVPKRIQPSQFFVREGVAQRLRTVAEQLAGRGERLALFHGWAPQTESQTAHRLVKAYYRLRNPHWTPEIVREAAHRVAPAQDTFAPPTWSTGGAVKLFRNPQSQLIQGQQSTFPKLNPNPLTASAPMLPHLDGEDLVAEAMLSAGFVQFRQHTNSWCYGTNAWALAKGEPCAIYGRVSPSGNKP